MSSAWFGSAFCPRCKQTRTLAKLPNNFKCADVICDFCGYLAQVKAARVRNIETVPSTVLGAAWGPQRDRLAAAIYFPLFLVLRGVSDYSIFYLSADLQVPSLKRRWILYRHLAPMSDDPIPIFGMGSRNSASRGPDSD